MSASDPKFQRKLGWQFGLGVLLLLPLLITYLIFDFLFYYFFSKELQSLSQYGDLLNFLA